MPSAEYWSLLHRRPITDVFGLDIYATRPEVVAGLQRALEGFRADVPPGTRIAVNELAGLHADEVMAGTAD